MKEPDSPGFSWTWRFQDSRGGNDWAFHSMNTALPSCSSDVKQGRDTLIPAAWILRMEWNPDVELERVRWHQQRAQGQRQREACKVVFFSSSFPNHLVDVDNKIDLFLQLAQNLPCHQLVFEYTGETLKKDGHQCQVRLVGAGSGSQSKKLQAPSWRRSSSEAVA